MIRLLALLLLAGCHGCASGPVANARAQVDQLRADYIRGVQDEAHYARLPLCEILGQPVCVSPTIKQRVMRLNFDAQDALTRAEGERTKAAIREARTKVDAFTKEADALPGVTP